MKLIQGDFYVIEDECMSCMLPEAEAPDLIGYDEKERHCFFKKQPSTEQETTDAISVFEVSCCDAPRYRGSNQKIIKRLEALGLAYLVDT